MTTLTAPQPTTAAPRGPHRPFAENDAILITDAGMEALRLADTVPDDAEGQEADTFTPDTADKADWVLCKIADARSRAARVRENMEMIARDHDREAEGLEWRFGAALQAFARKEIAAGHKGKKSVRLPNGVLGYRTKPAGVSVTDDAAALAWAQENCTEAVSLRLDKKALADALLTTGEAVDFAAFTPADETFYIK